jgi:hypothetical protein
LQDPVGSSAFDADPSRGTTDDPGVPVGPDVAAPPPVVEPETCTPAARFVPLHRLNKREFNAAVIELFGVRGDFSAGLPSDAEVRRFDNNAAAQQINGALVEGYLRASEEVLVAVRADADARDRVFACATEQDDRCAAEIVGRAARLAFRRDVTESEMDGLLAPYREAQRQGEPFEPATAASLRALLVSPDFLFRTYGAEASVDAVDEVALSGIEYATRLAGFIWGSVPDQSLLDRAQAGWFDERGQPDTQARIRQVVQEMLADPRSEALVDALFAKVFHLDMMLQSQREPDRAVFPEWNDDLRDAMLTETRTFIRRMIEEDRSPMEILNADYTFANRALAETVYGVSNSGLGENFERMTLPAQRRGLLTQPTILTMTSNPDHTSIVNRGLWVMENILCLPTPSDAPPDAPTETPDIEGASIRERLEAHRSDPNCAVCHDTMDPLGFGLENFDAIGRYRELDDDGFPVDARGQLPGGNPFSGAVELVEMIRDSGAFERCLGQNMLEFATGRRYANTDVCSLERMVATLDETSPFSEWVFEIVTSVPFSSQKLPEEQP